MVQARRVFVTSIHPFRTWKSGSLESVQCNACVCRLDLGLHFHLKKFGGNGVRTHVNSKGKMPSTRKISPEEYRTHDAASSRTVRPSYYQQAIPAPFTYLPQPPTPPPHPLKIYWMISYDVGYHCCSFKGIIQGSSGTRRYGSTNFEIHVRPLD